MEKVRGVLKKIVVYVFILWSSFWGAADHVYAQNNIKIQNPTTFDSIEDIINFFAQLIPGIVVLVFIAVLMWGGWNYLTAQDSDEKVAQAKKIIVTAIIGFILIVLAPVIAQLAGSLLGIDNDLFTFIN